MDITVTVTASAVTVYPDRARVLCRGEAPLEPGAHTLVVDELPLLLEPESVRVGGAGEARVRLLGVDLRQRNYAQTPAAAVRDLEEAAERMEEDLRVIHDEKTGQVEQAKFIAGMRSATLEYAKGLAYGRTTVADQDRLVQFWLEKDTQIRAAVRDLEARQRVLERDLKKLRQDIAQMQSQRPLQRYQARIEVEVLTEGAFSLELSYVARGAGWQPLYDLRLADNEQGRRLEIMYLAQVRQRTGQDWSGVTLSLSTARPALNQRLPELQPWYVDVYTPPTPAPQAEMVRAAKMQPRMLAAAPAPASVPEEAEVVVADVQDTGMSVQFTTPTPADIPSDGSPHKTVIARFNLDPRLDYLAIPLHTDAVFRRLTVRNTSPGPLLAGPVNLFVNDEFIGGSRIEYAPRNEEIEFLLGVEDRLTVKRELVRRDVDKRLLRDNRQLRFGYEIELQNLLPTEAVVELQDQMPISRHENIKVRAERITPEPAEKSDLNLFTWRFTLPPGQKQTVQYEFSVEHPRALTLSGLNV
ncbi:MAG: mucoidy inhibitor MuiA family protein [Anaerolineales bacterium]|nr:mucoidy inhibitor MuiA family protein [Anaerolineales bacterium]MCB8954302.1 mucoidy inhibitor MuiA family protein [Ardenticatenales bacterium]